MRASCYLIFFVFLVVLGGIEGRAWGEDPISLKLAEFSSSIGTASPAATTDSVQAFCSELKGLCETTPDLPSKIEAYWLLGLIALANHSQDERKCFESAAAVYVRIREGTINSSALLAAGLCYQQLGRIREAMATLHKIADENTEFADFANQHLAELYEQERDRARAKSSFEKIRGPGVRLLVVRRFPNLGQREKTEEERKTEAATLSNRIATWVVPMYSNSATSIPHEISLKLTQTTKLIRTVSVLVERFRMRYGRYPASLEEVAVRIKGFIPIDPFQPRMRLRYEMTGDRLLIWSVGLDERDDHHSVQWKPGQAQGDIIASRTRD